VEEPQVEAPAIYYAYPYRLHGEVSYLIWFSNEHDGVLVDSAGRVPTFRRLEALRTYLAKLHLELSEVEQSVLDLDILRRWLKRPVRARIDCDRFLTAWNLFQDVANSLGDSAFDAERRRTGRVYDKLFWGCNLPSASPPGKHYVPLWSKRELGRLAAVLGYGLQMFEAAILPG
jgi:hypothetical protein